MDKDRNLKILAQRLMSISLPPPVPALKNKAGHCLQFTPSLTVPFTFPFPNQRDLGVGLQGTFRSLKGREPGTID